MIKIGAFVSHYVHLFFYKCHRINSNCDGSYINFSDWMKNKKTDINPINKKDKYFQYAVTEALKHEERGKNPERIVKIKPFINKYKQEGLNFASRRDEQKKREKNI